MEIAKISVRLIAGLIARRIVPWIAQNDIVSNAANASASSSSARAWMFICL